MPISSQIGALGAVPPPPKDFSKSSPERLQNTSMNSTLGHFRPKKSSHKVLSKYLVSFES